MKLLLLLFLSCLKSVYWHEMHNSMADLTYNQSAKVLEVQLTIYSDDLLAALEKANPGKKLKIDTSKEAVAAIHQYVAKKFVILDAANRPQTIRFIQDEITSESVKVYFSVLNIKDMKGKKLKNTVLSDVFDDQVNMVNVLMPSGASAYLMFQKDKLVQPLGE